MFLFRDIFIQGCIYSGVYLFRGIVIQGYSYSGVFKVHLRDTSLSGKLAAHANHSNLIDIFTYIYIYIGMVTVSIPFLTQPKGSYCWNPGKKVGHSVWCVSGYVMKHGVKIIVVKHR